MTDVAERRWTAISGVAFVVLFVAAMVMLGDQLGSVGDPDRQFISYHADVGNRARDIVGAYLLGGAGLSFLWFLNLLWSRLGTVEDRSSILPGIAIAGGVVFAAMLFAAGAALAAVAFSIAFGDIFDERPHRFGADVSRLATQIGYLLVLLYGMLAAALTVAATSMAALKSGGLPAWVAWFGLLVAVVLLFSVFFVPAAALPIWVLVVSVVVLLRGARPAGPGPSTPSLREAARKGP